MVGFNEEMNTKCFLLKCLLSVDAVLVMGDNRVEVKESKSELTVKGLAGLCQAIC